MARWLTVLEAFADQTEWGVRDLATATGLSRSATHRIVREMSNLGILAPAAAAGRAQVGPTLVRLVTRLTDGVDVVRVARPILEELRDSTGETAILTLYDRGRRQFRAVTASESHHPIRYIWESLQDWNDLTLGASGLGILAFLPDDERAEIIESTPGGSQIPTLRRQRLRERIVQARRHGYVISHGDRFPGAVGVSAPIRDAASRVVGSILLGWPDNRTDPDKESRVARQAKVSADRASGELGYDPDRPG